MYEAMSDADVLEWIAEDASALADLAEGHGDLPVPECPGWNVDEVLSHVGGFVAGWYLYNLTHDPSAADPLAASSSAPPMPDGNAARVEYLRTGATVLVAAATAADLDATVWTFGGTASARYWIHRAASEVGVHRYDVELARGFEYRLPPERATMSCHETICGFWPQVQWIAGLMDPDRTLELPAGSCAIVTTDTDTSWLAQPGDNRVTASNVERPAADVAVSGDAHDMVMWLWGRSPDGPISIEGDPDLARAWNLIGRAGL